MKTRMSDIKIDNINRIFEKIRGNADITRAKLTELSDITSMSITRIVNLLLEQRLIYEEGEIVSERGRPARKLYVHADAFYSVSAYLDVDEIRLAVITLNNQILVQKTIPASGIEKMKDYVIAVHKSIALLDEKIQLRIKVIYFVCPGIIHPETGEVKVSAQLKWVHEPLGAYAHSIFNKKIIVGNDVKTALVGEVYDVKEDTNVHLAYMDVGYGVGVGVVSDGRLLMGANRNAGEIGHITVDYKGKKCQCGRIGCLDTVLNIESILERAKEESSEIHCIKDLALKYNAGALWAKKIMDEVCMYFAIALNNIIYAYDPAEILIGGKFFEQFEGALDIILKSEPYQMHNHYWSEVIIRSSLRGKDAYLLGGAIYAQRWYLESLFVL